VPPEGLVVLAAAEMALLETHLLVDREVVLVVTPVQRTQAAVVAGLEIRGLTALLVVRA